MCFRCQLVSSPAHPKPVKSTPLTQGPWQDLALDLIGPLPSGDYTLVVVDYSSRYYEIEIMRSTTSEKIIESLERLFMINSLPLSVTSDNGPYERYLEGCGIKHRKTMSLWSQANGEVERQNRSLLKRTLIVQAEDKQWKKEVCKFLIAYRSTLHTMPITGVSSAELVWKENLDQVT